jgi:hypothetical protein
MPNFRLCLCRYRGESEDGAQATVLLRVAHVLNRILRTVISAFFQDGP